jgi:hypothetical protein
MPISINGVRKTSGTLVCYAAVMISVNAVQNGLDKISGMLQGCNGQLEWVIRKSAYGGQFVSVRRVGS